MSLLRFKRQFVPPIDEALFESSCEGLKLVVLKRHFVAKTPKQIEALVRSKPTGSYARAIPKHARQPRFGSSPAGCVTLAEFDLARIFRRVNTLERQQSRTGLRNDKRTCSR
jgi:hypothetical protein